MASHKTYGVLLSLLFLLPTLALPLTSLFLQPLSGDLTRHGGYRESDFGWKRPQKTFAPPLYDVKRKAYHAYADVVVLGDSFSWDPNVSWPNYFVLRTGLSVDFYHHEGGGDIDDLLASDLFKERPPRVVVYETVERTLWRRLRDRPAGTCEPLDVERSGSPYTVAALQAVSLPRDYSRNEQWQFDYSHSWDFLAKNLKRWIGADKGKTRRLDLRTDAPFTSREKRRLLILDQDIEKEEWREQEIRHIVCALTELQRRVEANGVTAFVVMVAPDKLTAYADFLLDRSLAELSPMKWISIHAEATGLSLPRVDRALREAIREGVEDVYLPNDTHWGAAGHRLAAGVLLEHLQQRGVIAPGSDSGSLPMAQNGRGV